MIDIQPTAVEQVVTATISGLRFLEQKLPYEFNETIDTIERLYFMSNPLDKSLTGEQLRTTNVCPRHQVGLVMGEYGNPDSEMVCQVCEMEAKRDRENGKAFDMMFGNPLEALNTLSVKATR
jgi:hypothetical protein